MSKELAINKSDLNWKIQELKGESLELSKKLEENKEIVEKINQKNKIIRQEIYEEKYKSLNETLTFKLSDLKTKLSFAATNHTEINESIVEAISTLTSPHDEADDLEFKKKNKKKLALLKKQFKESEKQIEQLKNDIAKLELEIKEIEKSLEAEFLKRIDTDLKQLPKEAQDEEVRKKELEVQKLDLLNKSIAELNEKKKLLAEIEEKKATINELTNKYNIAEKNYKDSPSYHCRSISWTNYDCVKVYQTRMVEAKKNLDDQKSRIESLGIKITDKDLQISQIKNSELETSMRLERVSERVAEILRTLEVVQAQDRQKQISLELAQNEANSEKMQAQEVVGVVDSTGTLIDLEG